jgi:hypothetical protein
MDTLDKRVTEYGHESQDLECKEFMYDRLPYDSFKGIIQI